MKKKILFSVMGFLCTFFPAWCHDLQDQSRLTTTDTVSVEYKHQAINYKSPDLQLKDFKNKLVILDFWATWCSSCIAAFPKLYDLQKEYAGKLQVVLVNSKNSRDNRVKIKDFIDQRNSLYSFPCVYNDSLFTRSFPHRAIPYEVWLYNGKYLTATDADDINEKSIGDFLKNGNVPAPAGKILKVDAGTPLFLNNNGGNPQNYLFRSLLTGYNPSLNSMGRTFFDEHGHYGGFTATNTSITLLYMQAYPEYGDYTFDRLVFDVPNPQNYSTDSTSKAWRMQNLFCYESRFPSCGRDSAYRHFRKDLLTYFGMNVAEEERLTACWVLRINKVNLPKTVLKGTPESNVTEIGNAAKYYRNQPLTGLIYALCNVYKLHIIDESGYDSNVSLDLPQDLSKPEQIASLLTRQGFTLTKENRNLSFLVFRTAHSTTP